MPRILIALTLVAAALPAEDGAKAEKDPHRLKPDHARTPFSAAEIRKACQPGRVTIFRIQNAQGQKALQAFHFLEANDEGAVFEVAMYSPDGQQELNRAKSRSTWAGFQSHASFPEALTTRSESKVKTPAGTFECWQYLVVRKSQGTTGEARYYFAKNLAGPPVKMTEHIEGKRTYEMVMVEHRDGTEGTLLKSMGFKGVSGATDAQKAEHAVAFANLPEKSGTEADFVKLKIHETEAATIFKAMDKDANGKLTRAEFTKGSGIEDATAARRAFGRLDHNADGTLTPDEFADVTAGWVK